MAEHPLEGSKLADDIRVVLRREENLPQFGQLIVVAELARTTASGSAWTYATIGGTRTYGQVADRSAG